ncbi:anti-sigma factor family protein [Pseudarthrobacter sulfonivorans]|uniref:anti-sigma factor family protein n=1 Tax=Pseudarthrobacter sulfonivorans TaxID=121292 RepID=UPI0021042085|nr:anti-sigma factor [Pseudarthrobacter sulfonivorans]
MTIQNPFGRRHNRGSEHLQGCPECAAAVKRERQYIERLREAAVPPASDDLTARLLARTELLAATPEPAPRPHPGVRALALTAGGTAAAAGMLAVSAFALGGDALPAAGAAMNGNLMQHAAQLPADGSALTLGQLSALRTEGWVCPGFESLGFQIRSANAVTVNGLPAVELHLSDGQHYATVVEQHHAAAGPGTGNAVVSSLAPWTATYATAAATFTVESDLPADQADDTLPVLRQLSSVAAEGIDAGASAASGTGPATAADESPAARMERGIHKIGEMLAGQ